VLFDLFDTLVEIDDSALPAFDWRGRRLRSSAPVVFEAIREHRTDLDLPGFLDAYLRITAEFWAEKEHRDVELSAPIRMERVLRHFEAVAPEEVATRARELTELHMRTLADAVRPIESAVELLEAVRAAGLRTALVSNFDFAPTVHAILDRLGLGRYFEDRVISDEVGLRKPNARLFEQALSALDTPPGSAVHVGDDPRADAWGAARVGMRTVWIDRRGEGFRESGPPPTFRVAELRELLDAARALASD
jgi:putative hydrolase of the HAD superfamily